MTKNHQTIFLYQSQISLPPSLLSIPIIPPFLLCSLRSSLVRHFLLITGRLASHFFPRIPPFFVITGQLPTFLFFAFNPRNPSFPSYYRTGSHFPIFLCCQSRKTLLSFFIFRKHETHTSPCSLDGFLIYQGS